MLTKFIIFDHLNSSSLIIQQLDDYGSNYEQGVTPVLTDLANSDNNYSQMDTPVTTTVIPTHQQENKPTDDKLSGNK